MITNNQCFFLDKRISNTDSTSSSAASNQILTPKIAQAWNGLIIFKCLSMALFSMENIYQWKRNHGVLHRLMLQRWLNILGITGLKRGSMGVLGYVFSVVLRFHSFNTNIRNQITEIRLSNSDCEEMDCGLYCETSCSNQIRIERTYLEWTEQSESESRRRWYCFSRWYD